MMPANSSNVTSPRAHHHHAAQGEEDKENSAETQQQDDGKNNEKISGGSNARPKKMAHGKKSSVGGRLEAERAKLERVDEQRRSLQQRREREEAYSEVRALVDAAAYLLSISVCVWTSLQQQRSCFCSLSRFITSVCVVRVVCVCVCVCTYLCLSSTGHKSQTLFRTLNPEP
jgi:hypothetical protein